MIVHDVEQGTRAWFDLRLGIPTVSRFPRIVTAKRLDYAAGAQALAAELIGERLLGKPLDWEAPDTGWTERGTELEAEARAWYSAFRDVDVREVGFVTTDGGRYGGSPDAFVLGPDGEPVGGLEIKCRSLKNHMRCVMGIDPTAERLQVQGYLWITGLPWWDVLAYNPEPEIPNRIDRVWPDEATFTALEECLDKLDADIERGLEAIRAANGVVEEDPEALLEKLYASVEAGA